MQVFGTLPEGTVKDLRDIVAACDGLAVSRTAGARSTTPFPNSTDLELALAPLLKNRGFEHHVRFKHPRTGKGFEYDFWRPVGHVAMEILGYRAADAVCKDILKFHVHDLTRVGVVWVPRWKWISGSRTDTNFRATMKALAFADAFMRVEALVAVPYDWREDAGELSWTLALGPDLLPEGLTGGREYGCRSTQVSHVASLIAGSGAGVRH